MSDQSVKRIEITIMDYQMGLSRLHPSIACAPVDANQTGTPGDSGDQPAVHPLKTILTLSTPSKQGAIFPFESVVQCKFDEIPKTSDMTHIVGKDSIVVKQTTYLKQHQTEASTVEHQFEISLRPLFQYRPYFEGWIDQDGVVIPTCADITNKPTPSEITSQISAKSMVDQQKKHNKLNNPNLLDEPSNAQLLNRLQTPIKQLEIKPVQITAGKTDQPTPIKQPEIKPVQNTAGRTDQRTHYQSQPRGQIDGIKVDGVKNQRKKLLYGGEDGVREEDNKSEIGINSGMKGKQQIGQHKNNIKNNNTNKSNNTKPSQSNTSSLINPYEPIHNIIPFPRPSALKRAIQLRLHQIEPQTIRSLGIDGMNSQNEDIAKNDRLKNSNNTNGQTTVNRKKSKTCEDCCLEHCVII